MKRWFRRVRGAIGLGITWALFWAPVAVLIGFIVDPDNSLDEMWPAIGAYPGFLGGVVFSILLGIAARKHRLHELSIGRVAAWGAAAGLMVGTLPFLIGEPASDRVWLLATAVIGTITTLSAASAAGSLALAQRAERKAMGETGVDPSLLGAGGPVSSRVTQSRAPVDQWRNRTVSADSRTQGD